MIVRTTGSGSNNPIEQQQILKQATELNNTASLDEKKKSNLYAKIDKFLSIDETDISQEALKLYENELDIQKFTQLALSYGNEEDEDSEKMTIDKLIEQLTDFDTNSNIADFLLEDEEFLADLFG